MSLASRTGPIRIAPPLRLVPALLAALLASAGPAAAGIPQGIWVSDGYGWLVDARGSGKAPILYHLAGDTCLADAGDGPIRDLEAMQPVTFDADRRGFTAFTEQNVTRFHFRQSDGLPLTCARDNKTDDPLLNFDVLWRSFAEQYAFFKERRVDWYEMYRRYRPRVSGSTSPDQLYTVMTEMLGEIDDRHITLHRPGSDEFRSGLGPVIQRALARYGAEPQAAENGFYGWFMAQTERRKDLIARRYLAHGGHAAGNGNITWGQIGPIGYLRVDAMSGYGEQDGYLAQKPILSAALDAALQQFKDAKGVIIDLRWNLGGNDGHGLDIAARFTNQRYLAYGKQARSGALVTEYQPVFVTPAHGSVFTGPVIVLTSNITVSAGEDLVLALMGRPRTLRVGSLTAGAHSDQLMKPLPNGWVFSISNEIFSASDGVVHEGRGIAPDIAVADDPTLPVPRDIVLERAIAELRRGRL
jgi:hypothetical protein